jgi:hypothetical protein
MDQELRHYLELLLEHACARNPENCPECRSLQRIYEFMLAEIFSTVLYPETAIELRHAHRESEPLRAMAHPQRPQA